VDASDSAAALSPRSKDTRGLLLRDPACIKGGLVELIKRHVRCRLSIDTPPRLRFRKERVLWKT